jgi:hypothetical protein
MLTIVSGGQTGVDRGALDAALACGIPVDGWCPLGRIAEDGVIPARYRLKETTSADYAERTRLNVQDSDGTLLLVEAEIKGGTLLTQAAASELDRPLLVVKPMPDNVAIVLTWMRSSGIRRLNVAGPRESESPGIYRKARSFAEYLLRAIAGE